MEEGIRREGDSFTVEPGRFCPDRGALACVFKRMMLVGAPDSLPDDTWPLYVLQGHDIHLSQGGGWEGAAK